MKKCLLAASLLMLCITSTAQKKTITVSKAKIGTLSCSVESEINMLSKDTFNYIFISFKNAKYSSITDIASLFFLQSDIYDIKDFIDDLKAAEKEMDIKQTIEWRRDKYVLNIYEFNKGKLYIEEPKKYAGYTAINKNQTGQLIKWLENNALKETP